MGMVVRCNTGRSEVETLAWNFRNNTNWPLIRLAPCGNRTMRRRQPGRAHQLCDGIRQLRYSDEMTAPAGRQVGEGKSKGATEEQKGFLRMHQYDPGVVPDLLHTAPFPHGNHFV